MNDKTDRQNSGSGGIRVLLAGGDGSIRRAIRLLLSECESLTVVAEASSGAGAVEAAELSAATVAVIDCDADRASFIDAARRLRTQAGGPGLVLLDTYGDCNVAAIAMGAVHLLKDTAARELVSAVCASAEQQGLGADCCAYEHQGGTRAAQAARMHA